MSDTPRTDALSTFLVIQFPATRGNIQLNKMLLDLEQQERELSEANKAYTTVKEWAHRIEDQLNTLLDQCSDHADGTVDATPLEKFCNRMIGISNGIMLKDLMTLRQQRDKWKRCAEELTDCLASFGVNERSLETTSFVDVHSEEDISDKLSQALATFAALKKETKE